MFNDYICELREDEYEVDGVYYCKKCKTPRMFVSPDGKFRARAICDCQKQKLDREKAEQEERERLRPMQELSCVSLIGQRYKEATFSKTKLGDNPTFETAFYRCKKYCDNADRVLKSGLGLYIYGTSGTGKTHLASCIANELARQHKQVVLTSFSEIASILKTTFYNKDNTERSYIKKLATIEFLIIDDIGVERVRNGDDDLWLQEKIFEIVNQRYNNMRPTVFTSNYHPSILQAERGYAERTVDRIIDMSTVFLEITGESVRRNRNGKGV